jgi:3-hydroxybutyryl-CoA dehydrogenase
MRIEPVGVIGAGVMGSGVAQSLAQTGHRVHLVDLTDEILARARARIRRNLRLQRMLKREGAGLEPEAALERIRFTTDPGSLKEAEYLIENVVEKWEVKKEVFTLLDSLCPAGCIFASNTSAIPISRIASATRRPARVIGVHFMNPVPLKDTVEVIPGALTSPETIDRTKALLKSMNKECIVVNDSPGFVSNRVLMLTINEAIFVLQDKLAKAEDVDRVFTSCIGHAMGPLETADLIGLDTVLLSLEVLYESFHDPKYRPAPLLREMVDAGRYGQKSGEGFFPYTEAGGIRSVRKTDP